MAARLDGPDITRLLQSARQLGSVRSIDELATIVCRLARELTDADGAAFVVREDSTVHYIEEDAIGPLWKGQRFSIESCLSGWAILHRETVTIDDIDRDDRVPIELYRPTFVKSLAVVPVRPEEPLGALGLYWQEPGRPSRETVELAEAIAAFATLGLESLRRIDAEAEARRLAEEAVRAKDEFLALLGHELRNPLAPIVTALHLIKLRGNDPFERERSVIDRQVHHVVRLVDDLLDVSRITRGAIQLRRAPIELAQIVARGLEAASPLIEERWHAVEVSVPDGGMVIDADVDRMTQVVANLLTNAAKYTPRGGRIEVVADIEGGCARLVIRDNGSGIAPELLPKLFAPFTHGDRQLEGGLGLGLAIVRSLVELHGGVVSAASEGPGRGATFTIRLPLGDPSELEQTLDEELVPATRRKALRVLVVDDNIDAAETLGELLKLLGHQPLVVYDGPSALARLQTFTPDLAFMDIGLPVLDGYELAKRIRSTTKLAHVRLIALTGYGRAADKQRARDAGFDEHVVKPIPADTLRGLIDRMAH
ncbi:MAG TPA: ATP-binding protein [Kofleriaceae bacterium]|nr:ATP-binding protein [Kofleriaceae bacterium]